jgi:phage tail-like protein
MFYVELSGILAAMFTECSGLSATRDVEEVVEGGVNSYVHKLPGRLKFDDITLKRGVGLGRALWDWFMKGMYDLHAKRINFSIIQGAPGYNLLADVGMGSGMGKAKHWNVENAYPIKWELSSLNTSTSTEVAIETLQIAHHGLSLSYEVGTPLSLTRSILG